MTRGIICGIYKITNVVNGRFYIGSSNNINKRWRSHTGYLKRGQHQSIKLQRAWDKYGQDAFLLELVETVMEQDDLLKREQYYLDTLKPDYNMTLLVGATFVGRKHSPKTIEKMREAANRRNHNPDYIAKLKVQNAGWANIKGGDWLSKLTPEDKKAHLASIRGRPSIQVGRKNTPEAIERMRVAAQKRGASSEYREKLRKASSHSRTWILSEEQRTRMSDARKGTKGMSMTAEQKTLLAEARRASRLECGHWRKSPKPDCPRCIDEHRS